MRRFTTAIVALGLALATTTTTSLAAPIAGQAVPTTGRVHTLATRSSGDLTVALLDQFASAADVLTRYQNSLASESYLGSRCKQPC
jgi:hypothetical protein